MTECFFGLFVCLLPVYSFYLMFVIRAVDRLVLVFSGHWGMYQATHKVVFMLCSCISMYWRSAVKKEKNDTRKDDLIFPGKVSAKVIYLYRDAHLFSSLERACCSHSFFAFRHNLSTHEHLCSFLNVWSLVWGRSCLCLIDGALCIYWMSISVLSFPLFLSDVNDLWKPTLH